MVSWALVRLRALSPLRVDALLAALVVIATALEAGLVDAPAGQRAAAALPAVLAAAALLVRRHEPLVAQGLGVLAVLSTTVLADRVMNTLTAVFIVLLFITYWMAARETGARLAAGVALGVAAILMLSLAPIDRDSDSYLITSAIGLCFFVIGPVVAGRLLHSRVRLEAALCSKAETAAALRADRARAAAMAERTRIAGELHDVVAHSLGAMTVQAAGARRLAAAKPERAAEAFAAIESAGREALGELRTLLEALRDEDDPEPLHAPRPTLEALPELARRAGTAGLGVKLDVTGTRPATLSAGTDVTAYRIVQDALTAALHHGEAQTAGVRVRYRPERLEVEVVDDGTQAGDRRLLGLRERVGLYGGEVHAGAERAGGFAVRAWLPLEGVPA